MIVNQAHVNEPQASLSESNSALAINDPAPAAHLEQDTSVSDS